MKSPIFVALDLDDQKRAMDLAKKLSQFDCGFKVGPRLTYKYGSSFVRDLSALGAVFVDNKYHDIPSTVLAAIRATFESGATFATVHASNGLECLKELAKLEAELNKVREFKILCVTVLTSFDLKSLPNNWAKSSIGEHVQSLANDVIQSGLTGLVCSPEEVQPLRQRWAEGFLVTPGIRLPDDDKSDQKRVMGPKEAMALGASALVVGRPIVAASDPVAVTQKFLNLIENA